MILEIDITSGHIDRAITSPIAVNLYVTGTGHGSGQIKQTSSVSGIADSQGSIIGDPVSRKFAADL